MTPNQRLTCLVYMKNEEWKLTLAIRDFYTIELALHTGVALDLHHSG